MKTYPLASLSMLASVLIPGADAVRATSIINGTNSTVVPAEPPSR